MQIENILFLSKLNHQIAELINGYKLDKNICYVTEENITEEDLKWADAFVSFKTDASYDYQKVQWVHSLGAGVDHFVHNKSWDEAVLLTRTITSFGERIGEYVLSYLLKDIQKHDQFAEQKRSKSWKSHTPAMLQETKAVIYGTGEIGQKVAQTLAFFGMEVYGVSLSGKDKDYFNKVYKQAEVPKNLLNEVEYVINTLPLTDQTEQLFNHTIFQHVSNIGFINVGRGESVHDADLLQALEDKKVRFAVLDVFQEEPLSEDSPWWNHPNVWITPHISAVTTAKEAVACFVDTLQNIEKGLPLENKVDVEKGF
ncbi:D-2-hydroxyacid dehydrogenase [Gracilibacillus sp. S3-1-1]|uniref:D-2-hydroxyacid dehydrogenase n=1 Tax=Gracilibacillus pellucidus TaxID=3095368 RepID=A0ACC6M0F2_9BACI|nr:D-2-hydroxyacid dehydrogenase [Gracilibacillus sp. S3-1-1]MDX8044418.1 D-2-hydroxyacid dehydrogenase [Gracilibacillus sp. S3-1-1]